MRPQGAGEHFGLFSLRAARGVEPQGHVWVHRISDDLTRPMLLRRAAGGCLLPAWLAVPAVAARCRSSRSNPVDVPYSSPRSRTGRRTFTRPRQGSHSAMKRLASAKEGANNAGHPRAGRKAVLVPVRALHTRFSEAPSSVEQHGKPTWSFGELLDELVGRGGLMGVQTCPKHRIGRFFALSRSVRLRCVQ